MCCSSGRRAAGSLDFGSVLPPPALAPHWLPPVPLSHCLRLLGEAAAESRPLLPRAGRLCGDRPAERSRLLRAWWGRAGLGWAGPGRSRLVSPLTAGTVGTQPGESGWQGRHRGGWVSGREGGRATLAVSKLRITSQAIIPKLLLLKRVGIRGECRLGVW